MGEGASTQVLLACSKGDESGFRVEADSSRHLFII